ncbi:MAG: glutamine amidotransferase [Myxococcaceae bacterium]
MRNVLLLKAGDANNAVRTALGDYDRWFVQTIGQSNVHFDVVHAHLNQKLPEQPKDWDAVIMTGSPLSVTEPAEWMRRSADFMRNAAEKKVPVLGVCFGQQLLAWSLGGQVIRNPEGREIGTITVALTREGQSDPLFKDLPAEFAVQATHEDIVEAPMQGVEILAHNANTKMQAMRVGNYLRGVQFHPEAQADTMAALIKARAEKLEAEAVARGASKGERVPKLLAGIRAAPFGKKILDNFLTNFT